MRILQVGNAQSIHLQRWAEAQVAMGHEVHVASFLPGQIPGSTVHVLPTFGLGRVGYFLAICGLRKLWRVLAPDVVHAQYVTSYGFISAAAGVHPLVITAWGTDVLLTPKASRLGRLLVRYALRKADAVTTVAQHMSESLGDIGVSRSDVETIPFGVDAALFRPQVNPDSQSRSRHVISTRNLWPLYDVETVVRAVAAVSHGGAVVLLDLVGEGPERARLESLVRELGLDGSVRFLGRVDHKRLPGILAEAGIFVSSALSDGNNISLNEAMACGVFPIATDIPANSQWIEHGRNGYLYRGGDVAALAGCLLDALDDQARRQEAAVLNRKIVEDRADWLANVGRMSDVYSRVIAKRGAAA
jgi:glycosyltransferase involved in cell wall biosynthesis